VCKGMNFYDNLMGMTADELRQLLKELNEKPPSRKGDMVSMLEEIWRTNPHRFLSKLSEPEKKILAKAAHSGSPCCDVEMVNAQYGFSYFFSQNSSPFIYCFVFSYKYLSEKEVVGDVLDELKKLLPEPEAVRLKTSLLPTSQSEEWHEYSAERIALTEIRRVLQFVAAEKVRVSAKTLLPTSACVKQIQQCLYEPESIFSPRRSYAWVVLVQQCKWAHARDGKLVLTKAGRELLDDFTPKKYADGIEKMLLDSGFDEMHRSMQIKGLRGKRAKRSMVAASVRRFYIAESLKAFPVGKWVKFEDAFDYIVASGHSFRVVANSEVLYIEDAHYGTLYGQEQNLAKVYFRIFVAEPLATLGIVDLAFSQTENLDLENCWGLDFLDSITEYGMLEYIRLTSLGAFCLGATSTYEIPMSKKCSLFKVLPNHEIVVIDANGFSKGDALMLDRFAKKVSDSVWKMDKKTIFWALENGDSVGAIFAFLEAGSVNQIPKTVRALVKDVVRRSKGVTQKEEAVLVTFCDEQTAAFVEHDLRAVVFCRHEKTLFVRSENIKKFRGGLHKLGILLP